MGVSFWLANETVSKAKEELQQWDTRVYRCWFYIHYIFSPEHSGEEGQV